MRLRYLPAQKSIALRNPYRQRNQQMELPMNSQFQTPAIRVVILGGGFGGLAACRALAAPHYSVTLVDRQNHHLFQPLLYQVATGALSAPEIAQPLRSIVEEQANVTVLMKEVLSIDLAGRKVMLEGLNLEYDYLILALGARTSYFGHPQWEQYATGLKSLEDATRIRRSVLTAYEKAEASKDVNELERLMTTIVVGGGPTGIELAGSLAELAHQVLKHDFRHIDTAAAKIILVESGPRILGTFSEELSVYATQRLQAMGVIVKINSPVSEIGAGFMVCGGERIDAETLIWAAGIEANPLTRNLGVAMDRAGRLCVEPDCSLPGHPEVFAIGDLASLVDRNGRRVPGVSPAAIQMGQHAVVVIKEDQRRRGLGESISPQVPRPAFAYWDKGSMATIGRSAAVAEIGKLKLHGLIAWLAWLFVHLIFLVGLRNKFAVFVQWVYAYISNRRGARIIIPPS
jgi:NADH dehydrogenase